jgi:signal transduction histidine kinase/CheY-like chemotaxis protein
MTSLLAHLDNALLLAVAIAGFWWLNHLSAKVKGRAMLRVCRVLLCLTLVAATVDIDRRGNAATEQRRQMLQGIAPTYAAELEHLQHWRLTKDTPQDDPVYLEIIEAQKRWLAVNHNVADVYTMRRDGGTIWLLADSETDYNHDGDYADDREARTPIGEPYSEMSEAIDAAFDGDVVFEKRIVQDGWGTWVSALAPLHAPDGTVEGVVGVDYPASEWLAARREARLMSALTWFVPLAGIMLGGTILLFSRRELASKDTAAQELLEAKTQAEAQRTEAEAARVLADVLRQQADELRVQADTARTQAETLRDAAEDANRAKSQFLANFSHEIRTPLHGVIGTVELLSRTKLDDQQLRYVRMASTASQSLLELISDVIDLSKIEAGKVELESLEIDLRELLREVSDASTPRAEHKGLRFQSVVAPQIPARVCGDPTRLRQILMNLCTNAMKFTAEGGIFVRAVLDRDIEDVVEVRFAVTDTGMGIPDIRIDCLFTPFSQVDASTTRRYGGSGLGLAICRSLVTLMGGQIGVESEVGRGSTFWFTIPFRRAQHESSSAADGLSLEQARVVAVGDSPEENATLATMLSSWNINHHICDSVDALPALLSAESSGEAAADLVLLGCEDSSTVIEILEGIRGMFGETGPALLAITDDADTAAAEAAKSAGIAGVISRPVSHSGLLDAIVMSLSHCRSVSSGRRRTGERQKRRWSGIRVLIAEDNEVNQAIVTELLGEEGFACIVAVNGEEAVARALTGEFDLVLMDCQMPVCDGFEAARRIRAAESRNERTCRHASRLPILALTANALREDREACFKAGMDDFLSKPVDIRSLMGKITAIAQAGGWLPTPVAASTRSSEDIALPSLARVSVNSLAFEGDRLAARCGHNLNLMRNVLENYSRNTPRMQEEVDRAVSLVQPDEVLTISKSFKLASEHVGAVEVCEAAWALERAAKARETQRFPELTANLHRCVSSFFDELPQILDSLGGDSGARAA